VLFGLPLAWIQARVRFPGRRLLRAITTLPIVLPPVVAGVALLVVFGRRGMVGAWLDTRLGIRLPFTVAGAALAETFVAMPFFVLTMEGALRSVDRRLEEVARTLGASRWTVFRRVTLPLVGPSMQAGRSSPGRGRSASSAPRSRSPATSRAGRRRCRWQFTWRSRPIPSPRSS
jgi:molybdate transport system permease protein